MRPHAYLPALACAASALAAPAAVALPAPFVGASANAYFSDVVDASGLAVELVRGAHQRVLVAGYASVPPALAAALCDARRRGVAVRVVLDRSGTAARYSGAAPLAEAGVDVALARRGARMRAPFVVADDAVALDTGAIDAARAGTPRRAGTGAGIAAIHGLNVFRDVPRLAQAYTRTFWQLYRVAAGDHPPAR